MNLLKLLNEAAKQHKTYTNKVEDYINKHFYVFDDKISGDDHIDYIIEESKAKYRIVCVKSEVRVDADVDSGATRARAKEIAKLLKDAGSKAVKQK
jgi:hypothetical protein